MTYVVVRLETRDGRIVEVVGVECELCGDTGFEIDDEDVTVPCRCGKEPSE